MTTPSRPFALGLLLGFAAICGLAAVYTTTQPGWPLSGDANANGHRITNVLQVLDTNGLPISGGGSAIIGTILTNGTALTPGDILAASGPTNAGPATSQQMRAVLGNPYFPVISFGQAQQYWDIITPIDAGITIDLSSTNAHWISLTGNVIFAFSNIATNRTFRLSLLGCSTNSLITWPAGMTNFLGGAGTNSTARKPSIISGEVLPPGVSETNIIAAFAEVP